MYKPKLIPLAREPKRAVNLGPSCQCYGDTTGKLPPTVRQMRGSLSLLTCSVCGGLRRK